MKVETRHAEYACEIQNNNAYVLKKYRFDFENIIQKPIRLVI